mmetsp:Transcript_10007/g.16102  ORF Transcript_10007/g.16102 Transcript_10007/m.16102 type:complete len:534 (-) Transcript_10007:151-1752(-)
MMGSTSLPHRRQLLLSKNVLAGIIFLNAALSTAGTTRWAMDSQKVRCENVTSISASISFTPLKGVDSYDVELTPAGEDRPIMSFTGPSSPIEIYDLQPGTMYKVDIRAHPSSMKYDSYGWGELTKSPIQCTTMPQNPKAPRNVRLHPDHRLSRNSIHISWDEPLVHSHSSSKGNSIDLHAPMKYLVAYRRRRHHHQHTEQMEKEEEEKVEITSSLHMRLTDLEPASRYEFRIQAAIPAAASSSNHGDEDVSGSVEESSNEWSDVVWFNTKSNEDTTMLELVRVAENGSVLPDFLENHASADAEGEAGFMAVCQPDSCKFYNMSVSPFVRYCVEIQNVRIENTNTTNGSYAFSDYNSCIQAGLDNPATCDCDNLIDRVFAHESEGLLKRFCPGYEDPKQRFYACKCSSASLNISATYTGMMPVPLPIAGSLFFQDIPPYSMGHYPPSTPFGHWYHSPAATSCRYNQHIGGGDGCNWKRVPTAHIAYGSDLVSHGFNRTSIPTSDFPSDAMVRQNAKAIRDSFRAVMTTQRCCGC